MLETGQRTQDTGNLKFLRTSTVSNFETFSIRILLIWHLFQLELAISFNLSIITYLYHDSKLVKFSHARGLGEGGAIILKGKKSRVTYNKQHKYCWNTRFNYMDYSNFRILPLASFGVLVKALSYESRGCRFKSRFAAKKQILKSIIFLCEKAEGFF